ncbi:MAG: hypothetical protein M1827_005845 [Pycnora praestabilis]|nr:MAG: hypothetical protein M1827_005845 [Pycnora praestabilis]
MFDIFAEFLSSIVTVLFPIFASYKALRTSDPAQLTPWLMYWVVLSCALLVESWTDWILVWVPFYPWLRLLTHAYLVLPQTQGARILYQEHIHPFLAQHEAEIDTFISNAHDRAKTAGLTYFKRAIELIKENVFGIQPKTTSSPPQSSHGSHAGGSGSYAQNLLARFNLPAAREGFAAPANDFYGLLSSALAQATISAGGSGTSHEAQAEEMSASGMLIPAGIKGNDEKMSYISTQRERLRVLLQALDKEASYLTGGATRGDVVMDGVQVPGRLTPHIRGGEEGLRKSKSELEFETVEHEETTEDKDTKKGPVAAGGWMPWNWNAKPTRAAPTPPKSEPEQASASGMEAEF